jgi:hypothetical protein
MLFTLDVAEIYLIYRPWDACGLARYGKNGGKFRKKAHMKRQCHRFMGTGEEEKSIL